MSELNLFPLLWWGNLYFQSNAKPANCPHIRMGRAEGVPWLCLSSLDAIHLFKVKYKDTFWGAIDGITGAEAGLFLSTL